MTEDRRGDPELRYKLVELGAGSLSSMLSALKEGDEGAAHYFKGGFQALKEAAFSLFGTEPDKFRSQCMFESVCRQFGDETGDAPVQKQHP